jgi:hypothetical protein
VRALQKTLARLDQRFGFGCEPRFSRDMSQFGKICSMEYAAKAGLCRRLSRRVNMIASKHPVKAPRNASVIERLLNVRSPWPVRRNPVYAIATVQRNTRTGCMGITSPAQPSKRADMRSRRKTSRNINERAPQHSDALPNSSPPRTALRHDTTSGLRRAQLLSFSMTNMSRSVPPVQHGLY